MSAAHRGPSNLRVQRFGTSAVTPPGGKEKVESSKSENKEDAKRLLRQRLKEIDDRKITSTGATVDDLLQLCLADQKR